ncbi:PhoU domain-containing protein [Nocardia nova]|jgi:phosphate transport system protein|uniref:PhoU domain-containing protein n=1 Tax=Nocardia nova TaxID=37330 RepID=UPI001892D35F|nr:PhoU domain-containing protein [Nocardia nova]MBF6149616.1 hypothetical protein [Nocardia nova]MDN2499767.1 hypothetical protein [Nocardia nova]
MAVLAGHIATNAAAVLDTGDADAAAGLDAHDDTMDQLHEQLLAVVLGRDWTYGVPTAVDLPLLGRYYERFAENAVEVGAPHHLPHHRRNHPPPTTPDT